MIHILEKGRYLLVDNEGYIIPDVEEDYIVPPWADAVQFVVDELKQQSGISSCYVWGSVPRGQALLNESDLNFICITEADLSGVNHWLFNEMAIRFPFVNGIEIKSVGYTQLYLDTDGLGRPYYQMILKTQALHLFGEDVTQKIFPFKPGVEMLGYVLHLKDEYQVFKKQIIEDKKIGAEVSSNKWFFKRIVRSMGEIAMLKNQLYSRDLFLCFKSFAEVYPQHESMAYRVLKNSITGEEDVDKFEAFLVFIESELSSSLSQMNI